MQIKYHWYQNMPDYLYELIEHPDKFTYVDYASYRIIDVDETFGTYLRIKYNLEGENAVI